MIPTVTQQLEAIKRRLAEAVVPELPADAAFAREQVMLIGAALDLLVECHEHEYRYAVVENRDYRTLLERLSRLASGTDAESEELLAEVAPRPDDGALALTTITGQTERLKAAAERLYTSSAVDPGAADESFALLADVAGRQVEREASWYRVAGFTAGAPSIGSLLASDATGDR